NTAQHATARIAPTIATDFGVTVTSAAPTHLAIAQLASGAVVNAAFGQQPVVNLLDASGNVSANASVPVTLTVSAGASVIGTATVAAVHGVATFAGVG